MTKIRQPKVACRWLALLVLLTIAAQSVNAACPTPAKDTDVAVGIRLAPPFITQDSIRGQRGFTLELWQSIERELRHKNIIGKTELIECSLSEQLAALAAGKLDVVIAPLTITAERMASFDFSHQYLGSGITIVRQSNDAIDFGYSMQILTDTIMQPGVPRAIIIFMLLNLLLAGLVSLLLKSHVAFDCSISKEPRTLQLLRAGIETITRTTGLQDTSSDFQSTLGKSLDVLMVVIGALLSATVFGVLTAALIGSTGTNNDTSLNQLPTLRLATLASSTSQSFLEQLDDHLLDIDSSLSFTKGSGKQSGALKQQKPLILARQESSAIRCVPAEQADKDDRCITTDSWVAAMRLLAAGDVNGVVGDWAQLSYLARLPDFDNKLYVQSAAFRNEPYGWGISSKRPELRAAIDQALMERIRNPQWRFLVQEYLGQGSISSN